MVSQAVFCAINRPATALLAEAGIGRATFSEQQSCERCDKPSCDALLAEAGIGRATFSEQQSCERCVKLVGEVIFHETEGT